jgi:tetratricopeptide (TPR) repeat protein
MYLTHIDSDGSDSPAILIENATAANRAVNIPEFVNIAPGELQHIGGPALDFYRYFDSAAYHQKEGQYAEAIPEWRKALEVNAKEPLVHQNLGMALLLTGQREEGAKHLRIAKELNMRRAGP